MWYRALIEDVYDSDIEVFLIDFGKKITVHRSHVKYLLKKFQSYPKQSNIATLLDIPDEEDPTFMKFYIVVETMAVENNRYKFKFIQNTGIFTHQLTISKILLKETEEKW
jgi:hypothetical protein